MLSPSYPAFLSDTRSIFDTTLSPCVPLAFSPKKTLGAADAKMFNKNFKQKLFEGLKKEK